MASGAAPGIDAAAAVAQVAARAAELERQLEDGDDSNHGTSGRSAGVDRLRLERLENRVESLESMLDALREHRLLQLHEANVEQTSSGGAELDRRVAELAADVDNLKTGEGLIQELAADVHALQGRDSHLQELSSQVEALRQSVDGGAAEGVSSSQAAVTASITAELDRLSEARLASMWKELTTHAQAAAMRADQVEQSTAARVGQIERTLSDLMSRQQRDAFDEKAQSDQSNEVESLKWRMSWLEWSTKGEERGFGRPLGTKALSMLPPQYAGGAAPAQPLAEDGELWAREANGRQRMRRPIQVTKVELGSPNLSPGQQSRRGMSEQHLRNSRSLGRLPNMP